MASVGAEPPNVLPTWSRKFFAPILSCAENCARSFQGPALKAQGCRLRACTAAATPLRTVNPNCTSMIAATLRINQAAAMAPARPRIRPTPAYTPAQYPSWSP
jgi:hypothetical protein